MDVTAEILQNYITYGASDNTAPAGLSSSRSLNYASGPSIKRPDAIKIATIPYSLKYQDSVGLFGAENYFVKVTVNIDVTYVAACFEELFWKCAVIRDINDTSTYYQQAKIDIESEVPTEKEEVVDQGYYYPEVTSGPPDYISDTYYPYAVGSGDDLDGNTFGYSYDELDYNFANIIPNKLSIKSDPYFSVDLKNIKTGNIYIDNWLDTRLYTASQEEHPYDKMYVRANDCFYLGVHARNTRRLPYNIECIIGDEYQEFAELTDEDRRYIARRIS